MMALFSGELLVRDERSGLDAFLTDRSQIAVVDHNESQVYKYDAFDEFAEDCGDVPRFVKAVAQHLGFQAPGARFTKPISKSSNWTQTPDQTKGCAESIIAPSGRALTSPTTKPHAEPMAAPLSGTPTPEYINGRLVLVSRELAILAERVHAFEEFRKACENQHRTLTDKKVHKDGVLRGQHLPPDHPVAVQSAATAQAVKGLEDELIKSLERELKRSPLGPWIRSQKGLGAKTIARLLASIGDPYWNEMYDRPRTVSELWAFCGYRPGLKKQKGHQINWSPEAKMRTHNVMDPIKRMIHAPCYRIYDHNGVEVEVYKSADAPAGATYIRAVHVDGCTCSPYRVQYDAARDKYRDSVHPEACVRCGPKGNPAPAGSVRSAAHQDAMALRVVKKQILKDLWVEAKRIHEGA